MIPGGIKTTFWFLFFLLYTHLQVSASCSSESTCDTCVGTFSSTSGCFWCTSAGKCIANEDEKDSGCPDLDQESSCPVSYYTIIFVVVLVIILSLCCGFVIARKYRQRRTEGLEGPDAPLLSDQARDIFGRNSVAANGERGWMCIICGYDNKGSAKHCPMCGTSHDFSTDYKFQKNERDQARQKERDLRRAKRRSDRKADKLALALVASQTLGDISESGDGSHIFTASMRLDHTAGGEEDTSGGGSGLFVSSLLSPQGGDVTLGFEDGIVGASEEADDGITNLSRLSQTDRYEAFNYRRLNTLSLRQKVARRRKMWQREVDTSTGQLVWARKSVKETIVGKSQMGFTPRQSHANTPAKGGSPGRYGNTTINQSAIMDSLYRLLGYSVEGEREDVETGSLDGTHHSESDTDVSAERSASDTWGDSTGGLRTPHDSFDGTRLSASPGFTSVFQEDGSIRWEMVEPGMPAPAGADAPTRKSTRASQSMRGSEAYLGASRGSSTGSALGPEDRESDRQSQAHLLKLEDMQSAAMLPFKEKQYWFLGQVNHIQKPWADGCIRIEVNRENVLQESYLQFMQLPRRALHRFMRITFVNEPGIDAGGLEREWFSMVTQQLLDPAFGLFECSGTSGTYHINPLCGEAGACGVWQDHLKWMHFAGRFFGKAIMEQQSINATLSLPLRKQILAMPIMFSDLEFVDADLYRNLEWLKLNPGAKDLYLDFTAAYSSNGIHRVIELKPGGDDITVTDENKAEYLMLILKHRMLDSVKRPLEHFLKGLYEVLPSDLLSVFDYQELDLLMCGLPEIDVDDWMKHTEYLGEYKRLGARHRVVRWFWAAVNNMSNEERVKLLQFATGCSRLPVQGFKALQSNDGNYRKFNLQSVSRITSCYPRAHTCFNKIDLPVYKSQGELEAYLSIVVNMEITGFTMD